MEDKVPIFMTWLLNELQKLQLIYISDYEQQYNLMLILKLFLCFKTNATLMLKTSWKIKTIERAFFLQSIP
jgi:hypothetical protein